MAACVTALTKFFNGTAVKCARPKLAQKSPIFTDFVPLTTPISTAIYSAVAKENPKNRL